MNSRESILIVFENLARWCLYGAVLLTPVFFLPLTLFPLALNKHLLLLLLAGVGFMVWLASGIIQGRINFIRGYFNYALLGLVAFALLSAWLSGARSLGLWGAAGGEVNTFSNLLAFSLIFCLAAFVFNKSENRRTLVGLIFIAAAVVLGYSLLQLMDLHILPWQFAQRAVFNPIGTTNALAVYLGLVFVLGFSVLYLGFSFKKRVAAIALVILTAALFIAGFLINFWVIFVGWAVAALLLPLVDYKISPLNVFNKKLFLALVILITAAIVILARFNVLPLQLPAFQIPGEVMPSAGASWQIAKSSLSEGLKNVIFGSGPATYQYQYAFYKNPALNATLLWDTYFVQGFNAFFTHLTEDGILGTILWLTFLLTIISAAWKAAKRYLVRGKRNYEEKTLFWGIVLGLVFLLAALAFYTQNFVNYFMLFLLAGMLVGLTAVKEEDYWTISLTGDFYWLAGTIAMIAAAFLIIGGSLYLEVQHYASSIYFIKATAITDENRLNEITADLLAALKLNPRNDVYLRALSNTRLLEIKNLFDKQAAGKSIDAEKLRAQFINSLKAAVEAARQATEVNKLSGANWLNLAKTYENVISIVDGSAKQAFKAYREAIKLDPSSPVAYSGLGRAYITTGQYKKAMAQLKKAVALKDNYAPAHYWLAVAYQNLGNQTKALGEIKIAKQLAPNDSDIQKLFVALSQEGKVEGKDNDK